MQYIWYMYLRRMKGRCTGGQRRVSGVLIYHSLSFSLEILSH